MSFKELRYVMCVGTPTAMSENGTFRTAIDTTTFD